MENANKVSKHNGFTALGWANYHAEPTRGYARGVESWDCQNKIGRRSHGEGLSLAAKFS